MVLEALRQKREYVVEFRIVLPDGTVKYLESTGHPLLAADGERGEIVGTHVDVTERVRAQEQSEKLRQLESDLAHMNRLSIMGELTASLAHEILHPIATARNNARAGMRFLDMIPPDLGEVREALSCVVRDADRAKDIVGRIRDHIKKAPPRKEPFDLNEAINEVIVMVRSAIDRNKVSVRTDFMAGLIPVQGDRVQLQQVVLNLILNAVEAMSSVEEGARELSIRTEQRPDRWRSCRSARFRTGHRSGTSRAGFRTLLHHKDQRSWDGAVDLPVHHRRAWGSVVGRRQ